VASIRASQRAGGEGGGRENIEVSPGSVTMRNVRLTSCIMWAYQVQDYQISGPGWLNTERFDIVAKAAGPAPDNELRLMLRGLLADRFKLRLHRQTKEMPAYALTVGKNGHKLRPSEDDGPASIKPNGRLGGTAKNAAIPDMAALLSRPLRMPVLDMTGLKGKFDFTVDMSPYINDELLKHQPGDAPPDVVGIAALALQEQLGLKLEARKLPIEMLMIDGMEKAPTEN
jgi:uncharacterized protein (TIGR03435 family)